MSNLKYEEREDLNKLFQLTYDTKELYLELYEDGDTEGAIKCRSEFRAYEKVIRMLGLEEDFEDWKSDNGITDHEE